MRTIFLGLIAAMLLLPAATQAQKLPDAVFKTYNDMPRDAQAVTAAIVDRLKGGGNPVAAVRFAGTAGPVPDGGVYAAMEWRAASLFRYGEIANDSRGRTMAGIVTFEDTLGRRAGVLFDADYALDGTVLEVAALNSAPYFAEEPQSAMFVLPAEALNGEKGAVPEGHAALYAFARDNAVSWERPDDVVAGDRDYAIVVFLLDRISPSARFEVKLSDKPSSPEGFAGASRYLNDGDWRMGVVAGKFALDTVKLYVKAVITPGTEQGVLARQPEVVGLYDLKSFAEEGARRGIAFRAAPAGQTLSLNRFDGEWKFKLRMRGGNVQCDGVVWKNSVVKDGRIKGELYHGAVGSIPLDGTVSPTGEVKIQGSNGFVIGTGTGQAEDDKASGKFDATVDIEQCRGTWTAARIN